MTDIETLNCKLVEYSSLYSSKIIWGLDCDIEELNIEIFKLKYYIEVLVSLNEVNDCNMFPINLINKIKYYAKLLRRKRSSFCKNC